MHRGQSVTVTPDPKSKSSLESDQLCCSVTLLVGGDQVMSLFYILSTAVVT